MKEVIIQKVEEVDDKMSNKESYEYQIIKQAYKDYVEMLCDVSPYVATNYLYSIDKKEKMINEFQMQINSIGDMDSNAVESLQKEIDRIKEDDEINGVDFMEYQMVSFAGDVSLNDFKRMLKDRSTMFTRQRFIGVASKKFPIEWLKKHESELCFDDCFEDVKL